MTKLTPEEIERDSKMYTERGNILYDKIQDYIKSHDDIVRDTPLMSYAHAGLIMILDTYKTLIDVAPYVDHRFDLDNLRQNLDKLLNNLEHYIKEKQHDN